MKIGYFTDNFPPRIGGVATYSFELPYYFKKLRPESEIEVIVFDRQLNPDQPISISGVKISRFPKNSVWQTGKIIFKIIKNSHFDVVQATTFFPVGFWVALLAKIFKVKSCLTIYGTEAVTHYGSFLTKAVKYLTLLMFDEIAAFSQSTKKLMLDRQQLNKRKISVIYPAISELDSERIYDVRDKFELAADDFVVLFVGRLVARKGALDLIKAVALTGDEKIKLILAGGGEQDQLEQYVKDNNLAKQIFFAGNIPHEGILNYYQAAQVFSMPSFFDKNKGDIEGLGIVYLEAQINGLPVIGTDSGGIPEAIADKVSGFVVPARDINALADKIKLLKNDQELYQKMSQQAVDFVKREFNWQKNIDQHLVIYKKK
ncbi:MAG: hypothetical protein A3B89_00450 [Candidatus Buchananbacteria bacterium RIFCSPHIGHO2_02_FULL_40_13]|uniref:Glycosyl transferase family 1 domain-containing protein n=1 Tax=Candidatus Buchananbacteria bacterium RIFCSPLOWO2_01_FULL_39_33 TaxID=1797543 RepID=A0A1G1YHU6_9BACT|nr:MAG: hypothetical protein A3B89_00450 [Candidatus Buchananbacteria bacterium RIFCSPHIGHO2_02_FULL_40_13]OGY51376.1 MAG: hypothetical protein A3A02_00440 [Candidatus Buchananbacteria bacterium RIFCSPLOWO2_01_FULL_39_33]